MSGWVPMPADAWPFVADALAKPWPVEAIYFDLRWWADQERVGRARRPGRKALQERWGAPEWMARKAMAAEDVWGDPLQPPSSRSPAALQDPSSDSPAAVRTNAGKRAKSSSVSPASLQPLSSDSPVTLPTRGVDTPTPTPLTHTGTPEREHAPAREEAPCTHDPATEPSDAAPFTAVRQSSAPSFVASSAAAPGASVPTVSASSGSAPAAPRASEPGSLTTTATTTAATSGAAEPHAHVVGRREPRDGGTAPTTADEAIVLGLALQRLQAHTPGARRIQGGSARALLAAHREGMTPDDLGAVCRWLDGAPGWAATLRKREQAVDSWAVVLGRDWRGLVAQARRWEADGCPAVEAARPPPTARGSPTAAQAGAGFAGALARMLEREEGRADVIDVEVVNGDEGRDHQGFRAVAAGGPSAPRRLVDRARAGG